MSPIRYHLSEMSFGAAEIKFFRKGPCMFSFRWWRFRIDLCLECVRIREVVVGGGEMRDVWMK